VTTGSDRSKKQQEALLGEKGIGGHKAQNEMIKNDQGKYSTFATNLECDFMQ